MKKALEQTQGLSEVESIPMRSPVSKLKMGGEERDRALQGLLESGVPSDQ